MSACIPYMYLHVRPPVHSPHTGILRVNVTAQMTATFPIIYCMHASHTYVNPQSFTTDTRCRCATRNTMLTLCRGVACKPSYRVHAIKGTGPYTRQLTSLLATVQLHFRRWYCYGFAQPAQYNSLIKCIHKYSRTWFDTSFVLCWTQIFNFSS